MKILLLIIIVSLTSTINADNFDDFDVTTTKSKDTKTIVKKNISNNTIFEKEVINLNEVNVVTDKVVENIIKFQKMLPEITGTIMSLPKAGTVGIKFDKDKISIHQGLKLVAKRPGIDKPLVGNGVIYLKYNKYNQLVGKYTRSEVGKFDISDKVNSKWYQPIFVIGKISSNDNNQELVTVVKKTLNKKISKNKNIKTKYNKKILTILEKISTLTNYKKEMKRLFGLGVDYVVFGSIVQKATNKVLKLSIVSTYTSKSIFELELNF